MGLAHFRRRRHREVLDSIARLEARLMPQLLSFDEWKVMLMLQVRYLPTDPREVHALYDEYREEALSQCSV